MLTGDKESSAACVAGLLGIKEYHAGLLPKDKLLYIEELSKEGGVIMIGDGINDAPALARASVGIAMGKGGSAVTSETADIVMLNDNLNELPEIIELAQRATRVMYGDIGLWFLSNTVGFVLVIAGFMGPALAALDNFLSDFFPILNSTRLFAERKVKDVL
jgi:P-type E1-E2 ATPase